MDSRPGEAEPRDGGSGTLPINIIKLFAQIIYLSQQMLSAVWYFSAVAAVGGQTDG